MLTARRWLTTDHDCLHQETDPQLTPSIFDDAQFGFAILGSNLTYLYVNKALAEMDGVPVVDHLGRRLEDVAPLIACVLKPLCIRVLEYGEPIRNASISDYGNVDIVPIAGACGTSCALGITVHDVTNLRRLERLEAEHETLSRAVDQAADSIYITDPEGTITYVNPAFEKVSGYTLEEVIGKNPRFLKSDRHGPEFYRDMWGTLIQGKVWSGTMTNKRKDGSFWEEETTISPVRDKNGRVRHYVAVKRDLTERLRLNAETARLHAEVAKQKQQVESIIHNLPGVVWEAWGKPDEPSQQTDYVSDYVETMLGYTVEEWVSTPNFWLSIVDPEDRDRARLDAAAAFTGGEDGRFEFRWIAKDGRRVWVEARTTTIKNKLGESVGMRGVTVDITERKKLEAQLRQSQKMEAVGTLAGGIAHDFNNVLTVINGYSDLSLARLRKEDPLRHFVEEIKNAGERAASLTRQLLIFSRKQVQQPAVFDFNSVVHDVDKMLRRVIGENIELLTVLDPNTGSVRMDRGQLEQVLLNLAVNARDAMPSGGNLTIETKKMTITPAYIREHADAKAGTYIMLAVSDDGIGMDSEIQARIFEPFFTTKEQGKGTGLGLSIVYGIVRQADGMISVYSEPGHGTTFKIYLPCAENDTEAVAVAEPAIERGHETILLAEDEDVVRKLLRSVLEESGYKVLEARNPDEAIEFASNLSKGIDLLITDVIMPKHDGVKLAQQVVQLRPHLPVIYMSGYTDNALVHRGLLGENTSFLQKPFDACVLTQKVREVLNKQ